MTSTFHGRIDEEILKLDKTKSALETQKKSSTIFDVQKNIQDPLVQAILLFLMKMRGADLES